VARLDVGKEIEVSHLLASTCLPLLMQAVEVDGEFYWDGGYSGNPAVFPLLYDCETPDILMVHITPAERPGVPTTSPAIMNRMQELSFNTALIREMRTIAFLNKQIDDGRLGGRRLLVHLIEAERFDPRLFVVEPAEQRLEIPGSPASVISPTTTRPVAPKA
jgi:NTE family protein